MGLFDFLVGGNESTSVQNPAEVFPQQVPFLQQLFGQAAVAANQQFQFGSRTAPGSIGATAFPLSQDLLSRGGGFLGQLQNTDPRSQLGILSQDSALNAGPGRAGLNFLNSAGQFPGAFAGQTLGQSGGQGFLDTLGSAGSGVSPFLDQSAVGGQIGALTDVLQRNQSLGLNEIQSRFGQAGTVGSRAGLAGSELVGNTQRALASGVSGLLASDLSRRGSLALGQGQLQAQGAQAGAGLLGADLSRRQGAAGLEGQLRSQAGQAGVQGALADFSRRQGGTLGGLGLQTQGALGGLSGLGDLFNLGLAPFQSQFAPLLAASGVIGPPTVLGGGGQQSSSGTGGLLSGLNFGFNIGG